MCEKEDPWQCWTQPQWGSCHPMPPLAAKTAWSSSESVRTRAATEERCCCSGTGDAEFPCNKVVFREAFCRKAGTKPPLPLCVASSSSVDEVVRRPVVAVVNVAVKAPPATAPMSLLFEAVRLGGWTDSGANVATEPDDVEDEC